MNNHYRWLKLLLVTASRYCIRVSGKQGHLSVCLLILTGHRSCFGAVELPCFGKRQLTVPQGNGHILHSYL